MTTNSPPGEVVVVGSLNLDLSIPVPHLPRPGETVLGGDGLWSPGGKGANQAVAAARLGRPVSMVGCVGDDSAGRLLVESLVADSVDVEAVARLAGVPSGVAAIVVDPDGENSIAVSPGANARLSPDMIDGAACLARAGVLLLQFEVPLAAVVRAAQRVHGLVVVNPAPARPSSHPVLTDDLALSAVIDVADVLVPNRGELAQLVGGGVAESLDEVVDQARMLPASTVVTMGADGALVVHEGAVTSVPPVEVPAVDSTAAGDAFCGGLADGLARGETLTDAAQWAARVAAVTVTRRGAQQSLPNRAEVLALD